MVQERLQKVLARAGVASRRGAEELIQAGAVTVNGVTAHLGKLVDADFDVIEVRGQRLRLPASYVYIAVNKPVGYVSSLRSTHGELTVVDLVSRETRIYPVGRLDKDTSGLLLMTDDGDWANLVTHPRYGVEKEYEVLVRGLPDRQALRRLRTGVTLPDGSRTAPAGVVQIGDDRGNALLSVTVVEGKKRQIRLMASAIGHHVLALVRVRIGNIVLGALSPGQWRALGREEVEGIREIAGRDRGAQTADDEYPRQH